MARSLPKQPTHIGLAIFHKTLEEQGYPLPKKSSNHIASYLEQAAEALVVDLEQSLEIRIQSNAALFDRFRKVRRTVHALLTDEEKKRPIPPLPIGLRRLCLLSVFSAIPVSTSIKSPRWTDFQKPLKS